MKEQTWAALERMFSEHPGLRAEPVAAEEISIIVATNSMANATYFNWRQSSFSLLTACDEGRTAFSYHQNASTHGPPTPSAVLADLRDYTLRRRSPAKRVRNATALALVTQFRLRQLLSQRPEPVEGFENCETAPKH